MERRAATEPQEVVAGYAIYGEVASGGMATVHFGRRLGPVGFSRAVAIKKLHAHFANDPDFASMFLDEARLAARIAHPNVVSTIDVIADGGRLLLVMDYVQGETLARLLKTSASRSEPVPVRIVAAMMSGVLHGLHAAHEAKDTRGAPLDIVHRDVSPQNVIVGIDGVARVLDFGVAKASGRVHTTRDGHLKGKLAYMAPEQLHGHVSRQTDVFAASVVLWETLTCRRLFAADNEGEVLVKVGSLPIPPPSHHAPEISPELDAVVLRGLERDPSRRFATAREMALSLEQCSPLAPPSEVGAWVHSLAADVIDQRARRLGEIESDPAIPSIPSMRSVEGVIPRGADVLTGSMPVAAPVPVAFGQRRHGIVVVGAATALAVLLGLGVAFAKLARDAKGRTAASAAASVSDGNGEAPRPAGSDEPPPIPVAPLDPGAPFASASSPASGATAPKSPATRPARTPAPARSAAPPVETKGRAPVDKCDPPYERAPDGKLVPKPGCL